MAGRIMQNTFDEAVNENISDFEMSPDEAVAAAISQFEAQGVSLDNIVKEHRPPSSELTPVKHRVVELVESLKLYLQNISATPDPPNLLHICTELCTCLDKGLAERCLASDAGAYFALLDALSQPQTSSNTCLLECLASLLNGQPDILDDRGTDLLLALLQQFREVPPVVVLRAVKFACVMHEGNRQRFVERGLMACVMEVLKEMWGDAEVVMRCCAVYGVLTLDDDVRVPFGKAHEHAKLIVVEADAIRIILGLAADYLGNIDVLGELFGTLGRLAVRDEFCQQVLDKDGIHNLLSALQNNINNQPFVRSTLGMLKTLCGSDPVKVELVRQSGAEIILECISVHVRSAVVCELGCATIAALVLRHPANCVNVMECRGAECITKVLEIHPGSAAVQRQASMAVRNLVSRCPENCSPFLELGIEPLLRRALSSHQDRCGDEAKAALRDLGCNVQLEEQWRGTGRNLAQD